MTPTRRPSDSHPTRVAVGISARQSVRSERHYDERWEITGRTGYARVNRCTGRGIQQPSLEVYVDGEMRSYHALDDDWASSVRDSGRHWLRWLHTGDGPMLWSGHEAVDVLRFALAAYASSAAGGTGVDPARLE